MQVTNRETFTDLYPPWALNLIVPHLVTIGEVQPLEEHYLELERGNILFFPRTPFALSEDEREVMRGVSLTGGSLHKNIAYRPALDKVTGFDKATVHDSEKLREVLRAYSD